MSSVPTSRASRRVQYAALPYRQRQDGEIQIRLITSRETRRWVIPKGWPMKGLSPSKAAAREAYEEAGLLGTISSEPLGLYSYDKRLTLRSVPCDVMVFPLKVKRYVKKWPERSERVGFWFSVESAAAAVQEEDLCAIILAFGDMMATRFAQRRSRLAPAAEGALAPDAEATPSKPAKGKSLGDDPHKPKAAGKAKSEVKAKSELKAKTEPKAKSEPKAKTEPKAKSEPKAKRAGKGVEVSDAPVLSEGKVALKSKGAPKAKGAPKGKTPAPSKPLKTGAAPTPMTVAAAETTGEPAKLKAEKAKADKAKADKTKAAKGNPKPKGQRAVLAEAAPTAETAAHGEAAGRLPLVPPATLPPTRH